MTAFIWIAILFLYSVPAAATAHYLLQVPNYRGGRVLIASLLWLIFWPFMLLAAVADYVKDRRLAN
ncbi:hypothetical protein [Pararhizobium qamdonense]|uniref:hypothetical protein n=1 Tax=Pararhizobium qamdonense TaxID=3031126 RepID=UPI0023E18B25|nr:hypothetical protein [Pararhizobium qamdonense]